MSKTFNRQQAKLWAEEARRKGREVQHPADVRSDMDMLDRFRTYFLMRAKVRVEAEALITAIDDHVEKLTGSRTSLHSKMCSAVPEWWENP